MKDKYKILRDTIDATGYRKTHIAQQIGTSLTQLSLHINGKRDLPIEAEDKLRKFLAEKTA